KRFLRPALLQPVRPYVGAEAIDSGLRIRNTPSLSIRSQWCRCTLDARPCSFRCLYTISARPSLESSTTRAHSKSRTLAPPFPTNTPAELSRSHRVRWPRSPSGQAVRTITTIKSRFHIRSSHQPRPRHHTRPKVERRLHPRSCRLRLSQPLPGQ